MARARNQKGLTDEQVSTLREALAANRRPRVALQGNQFGDDARGQVVAVGDAAVDGDEFISVRVKLAGVSDTLRFSPDELTLPGRASKSTRATRPVAPGSRKAPVPAASPTPAVKPAATPGASAQPLPQQSSAQPTSAASAPRSASRRASGKRKAAAAVTVTVSSAGHSWTLSASRGGRSLLKATPVSAGVVTAVTTLFADPALSEAVADINQVALAEAEERADTLRKELAAVESILQSHRRPRS
ncbi:MAG: hypothetical protein ACR2P2_08785 [Nakamurella sp.]